MCLYPKIIVNPRYKPNKKNGGNPPPVTNQGTYKIPVPCGKCLECKKQKANNWRVRLMEEHRTNRSGKYVTMTFSEEAIEELSKRLEKRGLDGYNLDNAIATEGVRLFRKRYEKKYKKALRHWLVTELGQTSTERIHIHGIIYTDIPKDEIERIWKYGHINKRDQTWKDMYCSERTVNYIVKYVHKTDPKHKNYNSIILTSPGIGAGYINRLDAQRAKYNGDETKEYYVTRQGYKMSLPVYYRNKIYTDKEKEALWTKKIEANITYILGQKIDRNKGDEEYNRALENARELNTKLGYGGIINQTDIQNENDKRNQKRAAAKRRMEKDAERNRTDRTGTETN